MPSGTVVRCTGAFNLAGTITVTTAALGGSYDYSVSCPSAGGPCLLQDVRAPAEGISSIEPATPAICSAGANAFNALPALGGIGGQGAPNPSAIYSPGPYGGGGAYFQIAGGGTIVILAEGGIVVSGSIHADGQGIPADFGLGGGGGGVVVLASATSVQVTSAGVISANGGNGGNGYLGSASVPTYGPGGGGGGGLVRFIAPSVTNGSASVTAQGGSSGACPTGASAGPIFIGGNGGGGSIGSGGWGGSATSGNPALGEAGDSSIGAVLTDSMDPAAFFL